MLLTSDKIYEMKKTLVRGIAGVDSGRVAVSYSHEFFAQFECYAIWVK
jgi:hypothetical protein